jgi:hypothetical protein
MIIELRNIHAKWKVLIGDTCMLRANRNETMWNGTEFGMYGHFTNRWKTNYMGGIDVAKLLVTGTEAVKPIIPRKDLVTFPRLTLLGYFFQPLDTLCGPGQ